MRGPGPDLGRPPRLEVGQPRLDDEVVQPHDGSGEASIGNKAAAAASLGISRSSLYRKMREYRLS